MGVAATRRIVECEAVGHGGRMTLSFYSQPGLTLLQAGLLAALVFLGLEDHDQPRVFHCVMFALYMVMVFGYVWRPMRSAYYWLWIR